MMKQLKTTIRRQQKGMCHSADLFIGCFVIAIIIAVLVPLLLKIFGYKANPASSLGALYTFRFFIELFLGFLIPWAVEQGINRVGLQEEYKHRDYRVRFIPALHRILLYAAIVAGVEFAALSGILWGERFITFAVVAGFSFVYLIFMLAELPKMNPPVTRYLESAIITMTREQEQDPEHRSIFYEFVHFFIKSNEPIEVTIDLDTRNRAFTLEKVVVELRTFGEKDDKKRQFQRAYDIPVHKSIRGKERVSAKTMISAPEWTEYNWHLRISCLVKVRNGPVRRVDIYDRNIYLAENSKQYLQLQEQQARKAAQESKPSESLENSIPPDDSISPEELSQQTPDN